MQYVKPRVCPEKYQPQVGNVFLVIGLDVCQYAVVFGRMDVDSQEAVGRISPYFNLISNASSRKD